MNETVLLAFVGALQAIGLGYLEVIRRKANKCGSPDCIKLIKGFLDSEAKDLPKN